MISAIRDEMKRYNVNIAAFDHMFKQNKNAKTAMMAQMIIFLFFDKSESFRAYLILKNAYNPITTPNNIPIIKYSSKKPNVKKCIGFIIKCILAH